LVESVNERTDPVVYDQPFRVDVSAALKPGANQLTIAAAYVPQEAMVDPIRLGSWSLRPQPAGPIGPVRLRAEK